LTISVWSVLSQSSPSKLGERRVEHLLPRVLAPHHLPVANREVVVVVEIAAVTDVERPEHDRVELRGTHLEQLLVVGERRVEKQAVAINGDVVRGGHHSPA
jgi:hypothetical protein